jgi:TRAP-type C4-dicarboxylate transport system permease small subunit
MSFFERIIGSISKYAYWIGGAGVVAMMLLVVANILTRKVWVPIYGTYDFVGFISAVMVAFSIAYVGIVKGHVAVDMVMERFPPRAQAIIDAIGGVLSLGMFSVVAWQCAIYASNLRMTGEYSMTANAPFYPYIYGISFGIVLLCLVILIDIIKDIAKAVKR